MRTADEIRQWRIENPSKRVDLRYADLSYANLRGANQHGAYLDGANLRYADLRYADLRSADLHGAYLRGANLYGANLHGAYLHAVDLHGAKGIYLLNMNNTRGYVVYAQVKDGVTMIGSGRRYFTYNEALAHWGPAYEGEREIGDRYLAGLAQLDCEAFREWIDSERVYLEISSNQ